MRCATQLRLLHNTIRGMLFLCLMLAHGALLPSWTWASQGTVSRIAVGTTKTLPQTPERTQTDIPKYSQDTATPFTPRFVTGTDGRRVILPPTITRVAPTIGAFTQVTAMLSLGDTVIAAAPGRNVSQRFKKIFPWYAEGNPHNYDVGSVEDIILSGAQVTYGPTGRLSSEQAEQLRKAGVAVVEVNKMRNAAELGESILLIGEILGGKAVQRSKNFVEFYKTTLEEARKRTAHLTSKPRFISLFHAGNSFSTINHNDIAHEYIEAAGGTNVSADYNDFSHNMRLIVDLEQLILWDPEIIMTGTPQGRDTILADKALASISAVKNKRVYACPYGLYLWSVRSAEGAMLPLWLGTKIHPELFADINMHDVVKDFFATWYGYSLSDNEITKILEP